VYLEFLLKFTETFYFYNIEPLTTASRPALDPAQLRIQWVLWPLT